MANGQSIQFAKNQTGKLSNTVIHD